MTDDSGWVDCATLVNGAQIYSALLTGNLDDRGTAIKRRTLNFGKFKFVFINGAVGFNYETDIYKKLVVAELPAGFPVSHLQTDGWLLAGTNKSTVRWYIRPDGKELLIDGANLNPTPNQGDLIWFPINLMYISN